MSRYLEVREILAREIMGEVYPVGARFPTDQELCARFGVSRHTVREALRELQDEGVLARQRGMGTIVKAKPHGVYSQTVTGLAGLQSYAAEAEFILHSKGVVVARESLAELLACPVRTRWLHLDGVRQLKGADRPLCWTDFFIAEPFIDLRDEFTGGYEPFYEKLRRLRGVTVTDVEQQITPVAVPTDIAVRLDCPPGSPALLVRRRYFDGADAPFEISTGIYPAGRYAYTSHLTRRGAK